MCDAVASTRLGKRMPLDARAGAASLLGSSRNLEPIVGQHGVDLVRHGGPHLREEGSGGRGGGAVDELGDGKRRGPVDGEAQRPLPLRGAQRGNVEMDRAEGGGLEALLVGFGLPRVRQAAAAMPLQAAMERRPGERRQGWVEGLEAVVEREQGMAAASHDEGCFGLAEAGGARGLGAGLAVVDGRAVPPLHDGLRIDAIGAAYCRDRSVRSLYAFSDGGRRRGAAMKSLSHRASFH